MTTNALGLMSMRDGDSRNYAARVFRTEALIPVYEAVLEDFCNSLTSGDKLVSFERDVTISDPHTNERKKHNWVCKYNNWFTTGINKGGALARMAAILMEKCNYPLT